MNGRLIGINTRHLLAIRRQPRHRLRHPVEHGQRGGRLRPKRQQERAAALVRRAAAGRLVGPRRQPRPRPADRRARRLRGRKGRPPRAGLKTGDVILGGRRAAVDDPGRFRLSASRPSRWAARPDAGGASRAARRSPLTVRLAVRARNQAAATSSRIKGRWPLDGAHGRQHVAGAGRGTLGRLRPAEGVVVTERRARARPAQQLGLQKGDIDRSAMDEEPVTSTRGPSRSSPSPASSIWKLTIRRDGQVVTIRGGELRCAGLGRREGLCLRDVEPVHRSGAGKGCPRPLADRLRPQKLAEVVGQDHLVGAGRRADEAARVQARSAR